MTPKNTSPGKKRPLRAASPSKPATSPQQTSTSLVDIQDKPLIVKGDDGQILLLLKIDGVAINVNGIQIRGWSHGELKLDVQVAGLRPKWRTDREVRPDVSKALGVSDPEFAAGFIMHGQIAPGPDLPLITMSWQSGRHSGQSTLAVTSSRPDGVLEHVGNDLVVSGWALTRGMPEPPVAELFVAGRKVSESRMSIVRPDLIAAGLTREKAGFTLNIPPETLTQLESDVEVRVLGHRISGGPRKLDFTAVVSAAIVGIEDGKLRLEIKGWPGEFSAGRIKANGAICSAIEFNSASMKRQGLQTLVDCPIPETLNDGQLHAFSAEILFADTAISTDTLLLRSPGYELSIDGADMRSMHGWVYRKDQGGPVRLGVYCEDILIAQSQQLRSRLDVQAAHQLATPDVGFYMDWDSATGKKLAEYELRDLDTDVVLARVWVAYKFNALSNTVAYLAKGHPNDRIALHSLFSGILAATADEISFGWLPLPPRKATTSSPGIDVVIPVFGGASATAECIESVLAARNQTPARFILINDCSPDPIIVKYLQSLENRKLDNLLVIHQKKNGGFSQSVNIGMVIAGRRDVLLLNADTVVQDGWIDKLKAAADVDSRIATVTPLSNNGEIVTIPYICKSLPVDDPQWATTVDRTAAHVNSGRVVDIPVAIGFCMLIRRSCLDEVGLFDAATWGRGYGEEVDFCMKATALGWRHVAAADTFVVHRGNVSFGAEKLERVLESSRKISARYPFYDSLIQRFLADDPIAAARRSLNIELIRQSLPQRRILQLSHTFGGGTDQYVRDIAALYQAEGAESIFLRFSADGSAEMGFNINDKPLLGFFQATHIEKYRNHEMADLHADLANLGIERVHLHSAFGVSRETLDWIAGRFEFDMTVHDYAWTCPRVTVTYPGGMYCGEPPVAQCNQCIGRYGAHPGLKRWIAEFDGDVGAYRRYFAGLFNQASSVYAGAVDVAKRLHAHGISKRIKAVAHPTPANSPFAVVRDLRASKGVAQAKTRIALFGAISDIKGFALLKSCADMALQRKLPFEFIVFGYTMDDEQLSGFENLRILGAYDDKDLDKLVENIQPHVSFFLHQWPETFSYTLSHAQRLGIWPITLDIGAPAERVRASGFGTVVPFAGRTVSELTDSLLMCAAQIHSPAKPAAFEQPATSMASYRKAKAV